jgi:hypothetical protein
MRTNAPIRSTLLLATLTLGCGAAMDQPSPSAGSEPVSPGNPERLAPDTDTVAQPVFGTLDSVLGPNIVRHYADCRGKVVSAIWWCFTGQGQNHNAVCPLGDPSYVAVGGGAWALGGESFPGAFIVDGFVPPNGARDRFQASSKSHVQASSHALLLAVIGLKITGVSRDQLVANIRDDITTSFVASGQPFEAVNLPSGRVLLGGGASVQWFRDVTPGQLLVGSWGSVGTGLWQASSSQHIQADSLKITTRLTSIAPSIAGIDLEAVDSANAISSSSGLTEARVTTPQIAPTGIGSWATFNGQGRFLVKVMPDFDDAHPRDFVVQSKDHLQADGGTTFINVVGLRQKLTGPTRCVSPSTF